MEVLNNQVLLEDYVLSRMRNDIAMNHLNFEHLCLSSEPSKERLMKTEASSW